MRKTAYSVLAVACAALTAISAQASACDLDDLVGYTLTERKTIEGYLDDNAKGIKNDFKGCRSGRTIIFSDDTVVACTETSYGNAHQPEAYVFNNGRRWKMCVDGKLYDIKPHHR